MSGGASAHLNLGHPAGQGLQQRVVANLDGPGEEVRFQHSLQPRGAVQLPALERIGGVDLGQAANVDAEGTLHNHPYDGT